MKDLIIYGLASYFLLYGVISAYFGVKGGAVKLFRILGVLKLFSVMFGVAFCIVTGLYLGYGGSFNAEEWFNFVVALFASISVTAVVAYFYEKRRKVISRGFGTKFLITAWGRKKANGYLPLKGKLFVAGYVLTAYSGVYVLGFPGNYEVGAVFSPNYIHSIPWVGKIEVSIQ